MSTPAFEPVRWGVLGCASIATRKVIPAMLRSSRCDVVAIASRDRARAEVAGAELGIPRAYGSYDELLADADVEAVYIPLPNHLHAEWTRRAAAAGKHVLCEKPLAMSVAEAEEMIAACERGGRGADGGVHVPPASDVAQVRALVDGGAVGDLLTIQAFFSYRNTEPDNIRNIAHFGGGA